MYWSNFSDGLSVLSLLEEEVPYVCIILFLLVFSLNVLDVNSDDWQGLDGMVIQKNPDENVNHLPSATICDVDVNNLNGQNCVKRYFVLICFCNYIGLVGSFFLLLIHLSCTYYLTKMISKFV